MEAVPLENMTGWMCGEDWRCVKRGGTSGNRESVLYAVISASMSSVLRVNLDSARAWESELRVTLEKGSYLSGMRVGGFAVDDEGRVWRMVRTHAVQPPCVF